MQFLKTLFWVVVTVVAVVFAVRNWTPVTLTLWGGLQAVVKLPVLLLAAFLMGLLPFYALHRATRWRMRRRIENAERALADARGPQLSMDDEFGRAPGATPIAVPPAV